jgi:MFS superfamily sulfate permease-like transporter
MLIAVTPAALAAWLFRLPVETIGSHFGQLPNGLPPPRLRPISLSSVFDVLPAALSFTLLGRSRAYFPPRWPRHDRMCTGGGLLEHGGEG